MQQSPVNTIFEKDLNELFRPASVALIGASRHAGKAGNTILSNLITSGYRGKIFPVNPSASEILELDCFPDLDSLPEVPESAVICLPREKVLDTFARIAEKGVKSVTVISSGFSETGREGHELELKLSNMAAKSGVTLLGPNSMGLLDTDFKLNLSLSTSMPEPGNIAFFSQSGSVCQGVLDWAHGEGIGISRCAHLGNRAQIDEANLLASLTMHKATKVIVGYVESLDNGRDFMKIAAKATAIKPVIMVKAGVTPSGARAVSSHTGSQAGSQEAYEAAFKQTGIILAEDIRSAFELARAFSDQPLPTGPNLTVVTNSGGPGILAADACENSNLNLTRPGQQAIARLKEVLPPFAALYNPIDIIGDADAKRYRDAIEAVSDDPMTHGIMVLLSPTASVEIEDTAQAIIDTARNIDKPVFACFMGGERIGPGRHMLLDAGIPCYKFPERAVRAMDTMHDYRLWRDRPHPVDVCFRRDKTRAEFILKKAMDQGFRELTGLMAREFAQAYEFPMPETRLARTSLQASRTAKAIGYPVALKIASPHISRPGESGGVALNLENANQVRNAFSTLTNRMARHFPDAYVTGCMVQAMVPPARQQAVVRLRRDRQFGSVISFGLDGVFDEILRDRTFRLAPLSLGDAQEMVREVKGFPLLRGVRGEKGVDLGALEDILLTVSQVAMDFPDIEEARFGPIMVSDHGANILDVRVTTP